MDGRNFILQVLWLKRELGRLTMARLVVVPLITAQNSYHRAGELDQVDILLKPGFQATDKLEFGESGTASVSRGVIFTVTTPASQGDRVKSDVRLDFPLG